MCHFMLYIVYDVQDALSSECVRPSCILKLSFGKSKDYLDYLDYLSSAMNLPHWHMSKLTSSERVVPCRGRCF